MYKSLFRFFLLLSIVSNNLYAGIITPVALIPKQRKEFSEVKNLFKDTENNTKYVANYDLLFLIGKFSDDHISKVPESSSPEEEILGRGIVTQDLLESERQSDSLGKIFSCDSYLQCTATDTPVSLAIEKNEKLDELSEKEEKQLKENILKSIHFCFSLCAYKSFNLESFLLDNRENHDEGPVVYNFHGLKCSKITKTNDDCYKCKSIAQLGYEKFKSTRVTFFDKKDLEAQ